MIAWDWLRRCLIASAILIAALLGHQAMFDEVAETAAKQPPTTSGN